MPVVIVAPGQGSQTPGFLAPWLAEPGYADQLSSLSDAAGVDLARHGTESDADTIRDTAIAQPLIVGASLVSLAAVLDGGRRARVHGVAGHSVGELAAAAGAGIITDADAMRLVRVRSRAMADAAARERTGMSAVLGGDADALSGRLAELGLFPANVNGGGQVVVAGELSALEGLKAAPPQGARVIPLQVAGAFHTRFMGSAVDALRDAAADVPVADPTLRIWTDSDGSLVENGRTFLDLVVDQVASPVRWDLVMASFARDSVTGIIELAPAGALVGLARRGLPGVPTVAVKTPDDLVAAHELLDAAA